MALELTSVEKPAKPFKLLYSSNLKYPEISQKLSNL
jgi:hypothetical protein